MIKFYIEKIKSSREKMKNSCRSITQLQINKSNSASQKRKPTEHAQDRYSVKIINVIVNGINARVQPFQRPPLTCSVLSA